MPAGVSRRASAASAASATSGGRGGNASSVRGAGSAAVAMRVAAHGPSGPNKSPSAGSVLSPGAGVKAGGMAPDKDRKASMAAMMGATEKEEVGPTSFIEKRWFQTTVYVAIFLNAAQMGVAVDRKEEFWQDLCLVLEHVFTVIFLIEMVCKLYVLRRAYWQDNWNRLDALLVLLAVADLWILDPIMNSGDGEKEASLQQFSVLRILRVMRLVRMIRFLRAFKELWVIVKSILDAFRTMLWTSLLLILTLYVCAIFCVYAIGEQEYPGGTREDPAGWMGVREFNSFQCFGTLPRAMYTLFCVMLLTEWMEIGRALLEYQPMMIFFFLGYIVFTTFGVMNVIIGVIVDNTMTAAKEVERDHEMWERQHKVGILSRIQELIFALDADASGEISMDELKEGLESDTVSDLLSQVGFPRGFEPEEVMDLLDSDGDGVLSMAEFTVSFFRVIYGDKFQNQCLSQSNLHAIRRALRTYRQDTRKQMDRLMKKMTRVEEAHFPLQEPCGEETLDSLPAAPGTSGTPCWGDDFGAKERRTSLENAASGLRTSFSAGQELDPLCVAAAAEAKVSLRADLANEVRSALQESLQAAGTPNGFNIAQAFAVPGGGAAQQRKKGSIKPVALDKPKEEHHAHATFEDGLAEVRQISQDISAQLGRLKTAQMERLQASRGRGAEDADAWPATTSRLESQVDELRELAKAAVEGQQRQQLPAGSVAQQQRSPPQQGGAFWQQQQQQPVWTPAMQQQQQAQQEHRDQQVQEHQAAAQARTAEQPPLTTGFQEI